MYKLFLVVLQQLFTTITGVCPAVALRPGIFGHVLNTAFDQVPVSIIYPSEVIMSIISKLNWVLFLLSGQFLDSTS